MGDPRLRLGPAPAAQEDSWTDAPAAQPVPLSSGQRALWIAQRLSPGVPICEAQYIEFRGDLDVDLLRRVSIRAGREFQSGYLRLVEVEGEPFQVFDPTLESEGPVIDMRDEPDPMAAALRWMRQEYTAPLDMTRDRLTAWTLVQVGDQHFLWYSRIHHVALDGYAAMTMVNRVAALYTAAVQGRTADQCEAADLRTLYEIDRSYRESERFANDQAYWADRLAGVQEMSNSATAPAPASAHSVAAIGELPAGTVDGIQRFARASGASPAAVVIAAYGCHLARMTGRDQAMINVPVSGRTTAVLRRSGGVFVNVAPMPIDIDERDTAATLVRRVQSDLIAALRHQRCGLSDIRAAAGHSGQRRFAGPMVNVMFFSQEIRLGSITGEFHILSSGPVEDLLIDLYQTGDPPRTVLHFMANPALYTGGELTRQHTAFAQFLDAFTAVSPDTALGQVHPESVRAGARIRRRRESLEFWRATLAELPEELSLPVDRPRRGARSDRWGTRVSQLRAGLVEGLERVARECRCSLFTVVHGALAVLLARSSGSGDIWVGTPATRHDDAPVDPARETLADTVVLRTEVDLAESFADFLVRVRRSDRDAFDHADVPLDQLVDRFAPQRSRHSLCPVMVEFQKSSPGDAESSGADLPATDLSGDATGCDLRVVVAEGGRTVRFIYATDLFDVATIDSLARRWIRILESVVADPSVTVGAIDVLDPAERVELSTRRGGPGEAPVTLADLLSSAVARDPERVAVVSGNRRMSYRELDEESNRLARVLAGRGIGPEDVVAVAIPRSPESVSAVWAVAKSGAAFLPVDPTHPTARIAHMVSDSRAAIGVTVESARDRLPDDVEWLTLGAGADRSSRPVTDSERTTVLRPQHPAYLIYTSGSTGVPKGVTVTHAGLAALSAEQRERYGVTADSRTLHLASPSFDASIWELLLAVGASATMVIAPPETYGGAALAELLRAERVTHAVATPAALTSVDPAGLDRLEVVVAAGEACSPDLVRRWASGGRRFFDAYGPTEATIMTNQSDSLAPGDLVTIGGPIRGVAEWVLDQRLQPVPVGVAGELYVAGDVLARGYHGRPALTAERFVACPWLPGARMYRTGDVVRWTAQGTVEHVGRSDFQVKIRGQRVELGEIDARLAEHESVAFAVTVGHRGGSGSASLVSYVVAASGCSIDTVALSGYLSERLPSYMVPASIMVLDRVPLTPVGKLDRKALPEPVFADAKAFRAPETPMERTIAEAFAEVLGVDAVGLDDSFFALGGDSLTATRVVARLGAAFDTEIPMQSFFETPTVAALATRIERHAGTGRQRPPLVAGPRPELVPLAPAQQRMWFFNQYDTASGAYNMPIALRLRGELDIDALRSAMADVLARHESLRTRYPDHDGTLIQVIEPPDRVDHELSVVDARSDELLSAVTEFAGAGFDVSSRAPVRARLFRAADLDEPEYVLAVVVHHIAADGFSMTPLARDVMTAYSARIRGQAPSWAPLPIQYADYALWQRAALGSPDDPHSLSAEQIRYWTEALDGAPEELSLPFDRPRPVVRSNRSGSCAAVSDAGLVAGLERVARECGSSLFMVVHGALAVLLARLSDTGDVSVGTPVSGRGDAVLDGVVGMFVNTVVLRTEVDSGESFADFLGRVRRVDLDAFGRADVPFEQLVDRLAPVRSQSRHPLFQVLLVFQDPAGVEVELPGLDVSVLDVPEGVAGFDLRVVVSGAPGGGLLSRFTYARDLFDAVTVEAVVGRWVRILESVVADPSVALGAIDVLAPAERADLLTRRGAPGETPSTLADLLSSAAARDPDGIAVVSGDRRVSYRELDEDSNRLARLLVARGAGPEDVVAVAIPRSPESVAAVCAVAKSGAAFLPVDPAYPAERIAHMLADSRAVLGVTVESVRDRLPETVYWLTAEEAGAEFGTGPVTDADRIRPLRIDDIAYVIYTSGSAGLPKGVAVGHRGLRNCAAEHRDAEHIESASRVLHLASPSFDVSVGEFLSALCNGATLVIAPSDVYGGDELAALLEREEVGHVCITPSALSTIDHTRWPLPNVRSLVVGGENYGTDLIERWSSGRRFCNSYGPTEATIMTNQSHPLTPDDLVTIGGPIRGVAEWVLDQRLQPVPVGVAGELYVAGDVLARGYHGRPALTAERFVACPWLAGARMYRTGDMARWTADGAVEYLGRSDFQVKIRGQRVELGEIDARLAEHDSVAFAVTVGHRGGSGSVSLVSYVVAEPGCSADPLVLSEYLSARLPSSMVPASIMVLDRVPLTPVGKLDRKALPEPVFADAKAFRAPETPMERTIAEAFADVLGVEQVGADDSFFALGGDSIMSIQLVTRAKASGVVFSARDVFECKTVAGLARVAVRADSSPSASLPAELPGGGVGPIPLTPVLREFVERANGAIERNSQAVMLDLPAGTTRQALAGTVQAVLDRHDMLRTRLHRTSDGDWTWEALPVGTIRADDVVRRVATTRHPGGTEFRASVAAEMETAADRLDPEAGLVVQAVWFDPADAAERGRILLLVHRSAIDETSWGILVSDLAAAWARIESGAPPAAAPAGTSMRSWAHGLLRAAQLPERVAEFDMWTAIAHGDDPVIGRRRLDPAIDVAATGCRFEIDVPPADAEALSTDVPAAFHGDVRDILLTALAVAVTKWRRVHTPDGARTDLLVGLRGHGRAATVVPGADIAETVGWFSTSFPLRLDLSGIDLDDAGAGGPALGAAVKSVKEQLRAVPDHGIGYGLLRYLNDDTGPALGSTPEPQIRFGYTDPVSVEPAEGVAAGWMPVQGDPGDARCIDISNPGMPLPAVLDIDARVVDAGGPPRLRAIWSYPAGVLDADEVREMARSWREVLTALVRGTRRPGLGGRTPSDLDLVRLSQNEIERLEDRYPAASDIWPLTPLQEGLLFHALVSEDSVDAYVVQLVLDLRGQVDPDRLRRAGQTLLERHANLRAAFVTDVGPVQVVEEGIEAPWSKADLSGLGEDARDREWELLLAADRASRFDPARAPLLRWMLVTLEASRYRLVLTNHHLLLDGWSAPLLVRELLTLYATDGDATVLPAVHPYRDFLRWMVEQDRAASLAAWARAFDGAEQPTQVAPPDPRRRYTRSREVHGELTEDRTEALQEFARTRGITLNTVIQTAWATVLAALTARDDVTFGATVSGRPPQVPGVEEMIGLFIATVPVRVRLDITESLGQLLDRVQAEQAALLGHHHVGLTDIEHAAGPGTVFDTMTVFESYPVDREALASQIDIAGLRLVDVTGIDAAHYPLGVVAHVDTRLRLRITYLPELFDQDTMQTILGKVLTVIGVVAVQPDLPLAALNLLSPAEYRELTSVTGDPAVPERVLPDLLAATVAEDPEAVAVACEERRWTYGELDAESNRLARVLIGRGVGPETCVAVGMARSVESVLAVWAVTKSGAAFVPVDPQYPADRVGHMLADSAVTVGITLSQWRDQLPGSVRWLVLDDPALEAEIAGSPAGPVTDAERLTPLRVDQAAYIIYTSGSTGVPKGVVVTHRGLANLVTEQCARFGVGPGTRVSHVASPSFDAAILEYLWAFASGAQLVIVPPTVYGGAELARILSLQKVTHAALTPAALGTLDPAGLDDLGTVVVGGEAPTPDLVSRWAPGRRLFNTYGPAEATIQTDAGTPMVAGEAVTIGGPIRGVGEVVLDPWLRPVPVGFVGELYLTGPGLARGYRNQGALTASRFVANPFAEPGQRMYRTGDMVRWSRSPDGRLALDYVGRADLQVKVRGFRIELGEVESALRACPGVRHAAAKVQRGDSTGDRLIGYVVPEPGAGTDPAAVLAHLGQRLAPQMVPATVVVLEALPVTPNGKLDRAALPEPDFSSGRTEFRAPATEVEKVLAGLFAEVLGLDEVGVDDSFFALGGDSIMSIQLVTRAKAAGVVLSAREVFECRTVAGLARVAERAENSSAASLPAELPGGGVGPIPLTPIMCWMFERGDFDRFCQWVLLTLPVGIDTAGIAGTVQAVIDHHDMLRARIHPDPAHPSGWALQVQPVAASAAASIRRVPVDVATDSRSFATIVEAEANAAAERLDPAAGRMLQLVWFDRAGQPGRLLVVAHHLVVDGVSWRILVPDLAAAWAEVSAGRRPRLAPVGTSMRRWAHALRTAAADIDEYEWWRSMLGGDDPPLGTRPLDPAVDVQASAVTAEVTLPAEVTRAVLTTLPRAFHGNVDDAMIAGLALALVRRQRGHGHAVTGTLLTLESHGRHDEVLPGADLTRTVGWFTTTYPVRLDLSGIDIDEAFEGGPAAGAAVKSVKEQLRRIPRHGIGYGLMRYLAPDAARIASALPDPQVSFNYLGRFDTLPASLRDIGWMPAGGDFGAGGAQNPTAPVAAALGINAVVVDTPDGPVLTAAWDYPTGVFTSAEVAELMASWRAAMSALATHAGRPGAGGLTPSDLGLVDLEQAAIDRFENRYPGLEDIWPLTPLQAGLLFHAELAADSRAAGPDAELDPYTVQLAVDLGGRVDPDRLHRAARALVGRHQNLRTAFVRDTAGNPVQVVRRQVDVPFTRADLTERDDAATALEELMDADRRAGFDVTAAPLLRLVLIRTAPARHRLLVSMHHILIDGWSTPLLIRELLTLYASDSDPASLASVRPYRDYLAWLGEQDQGAGETAWARALDGVTEPTLLAPEARGRRLTAAAQELDSPLSEERTAALVATAHRAETTLNTLVQTAWGIVLATETAREDVVFGATVSGRPPQISGIESMIGLFVNTVPVRIRLDQRESLDQLVRRVQAEQTALFDHQHIGLSRIDEVAGPGAMFDTVTVFESYPVDRAGLSENTDIAGMRVLDVRGRDAAHYPLGVIVHQDTRLHLIFKYLPDLFTAQRIGAISERVLRVLDAMAEDIERPLGQLRLLSPAEQSTLVPVRGAPGVPTAVLPQVLTAAMTPETEALACGDVRLSYRELDETSNRWARVLIAAGAGPETFVAVALPRSAEAVIAVWAVAKTGAAFVPIDPAHPRERIARILTDSGAAVGVTLGNHRDRLPDTVGWLDVDAPSFVAAAESAVPDAITDADRTATLRPEHPAYLIYTSGSTGVPKGVVVTHTGLANLAAEARERFAITPAARVLGAASPSFDVSILELLTAAAGGATLVPAPATVVGGPELAEVIAAEHLTHAALTPTVLGSLRPETVDTLTTLVLGGETLPPDLANRWIPGRTVINTYGASEYTIMSCARAPLTTATESPIGIGGPVRGFAAVVLDARLRPVPAGVVGELYLSGPGLARCYHGQPALTAARFVADPYGPAGTQLYRTGDLVAWNADRTLRYAGRSDLQIELAGNRIEPGDIETALRGLPGITHAAVTVHTRPDGAAQLVGYVVPAPGATPDATAMTTRLATLLPTHMIPTALITLDRIPLTRTGKLDYRALPAPDGHDAGHRPPATPLEQIVCTAFGRTLDIERVGVDDGFFALGGNSLAAARLVTLLAESTGATVPIRWIFTAPTPRALAERIDARLRGSDDDRDDEHDSGVSVLLPLRADGDAEPLFCVHPAIGLAWGFSGLVQHLDPDRPVYGLQSPALTEPTARFDTLGQLAARYVREIRSVQPHGPYHLLGYSLGGTIAHAIAVQLRRDGDTVATLAMMDTRVVAADSVLAPAPSIADMLTEFGGIAGSQADADLTFEAAAELLHRQGGLFTVLTPEHLEILHRDYSRLIDLTRVHRPELLDGDLIYFRAGAGDAADGPSPARAWGEHITGSIVEHLVPGRHERMTDPDALRAIGLVLTRHFRSARLPHPEQPAPE
ncbi:non-ribosomal peptide synthetase [Nocardia higoensis]|uniref:non-ribosomal peptide synthetase n=1 Tax=Nocardia higoensis TaxID=228599 RepID=UPI000307DB05|nr:non-ribosomal peptide synthetase [Nocardia higoensis]